MAEPDDASELVSPPPVLPGVAATPAVLLPRPRSLLAAAGAAEFVSADVMASAMPKT